MCAAAVLLWIGHPSALGWLAIIYMVILPVYVAYMIWNWAIARRGVAAATSFSLLVPIVSGALSAWLFGEQFGPYPHAQLRIVALDDLAGWIQRLGEGAANERV